MSQRARISLSGEDSAKVDSVCAQIKGISQRTGVDIRGPVPLPTKKLRVPCRKSPDGEGSETWDHWEKRIHKRLIDLDADERALRQLMRIQVPDGVNIEIVMVSTSRSFSAAPEETSTIKTGETPSLTFFFLTVRRYPLLKAQVIFFNPYPDSQP